MIKTKKRKKSSRNLGKTTAGHGARKKWKKSGHRGGKGMAGTGKRADHKKTLMTKLYGHGYFGKQGITSKGTAKDKDKRIDLRKIVNNLETFCKKTSKGYECDLKGYKILGDGVIKEKLVIHAKSASKNAVESVKKAGGEIILPVKKKKNVQLVKDIKEGE